MPEAVIPATSGHQVTTLVTAEVEGGDKPACVVECLSLVIP